MKRMTGWVLCAAWLAAGAAGAAPPERVPQLTERSLSRGAYVELAQAWKQYMEEHGETVDGLLNLGQAYFYSNQLEAAVTAARRAVELGPDDPDALAFLGKTRNTQGAPLEETTPLLERCISLVPDHRHGLMTLTGIYLRYGKLDDAAGVLKGVFEQRLIPRPLQDYAYNMLVGLPQGAVLVTNGDNDTFPPLALQAGMGLRTDVTIVNRSLLNAAEYAEAVFDLRPELRPRKETEPYPGCTPSALRLRAMVKEQGAPLYFAATTVLDDLDANTDDWVMDGINRRVGGAGLSAEENANLLLERFRLDSATDWGIAWDLTPSLGKLIRNYPAAMMRAAEREDLPPVLREKLLDRAARIAEFHEMADVEAWIQAMRKKS